MKRHDTELDSLLDLPCVGSGHQRTFAGDRQLFEPLTGKITLRYINAHEG